MQQEEQGLLYIDSGAFCEIAKYSISLIRSELNLAIPCNANAMLMRAPAMLMHPNTMLMRAPAMLMHPSAMPMRAPAMLMHPSAMLMRPDTMPMHPPALKTLRLIMQN
ncbi:hypothetical protein [Nostoc sp.]|uniref:hypothetical protein n=1 Tax=Nostoc sp. TaxID=1180 RepID=UPI002FEF72CC